MIYFDNAATSWPKPPGVAEAMVHFIEDVGANPGRSGHRLSVEAGRTVYEARELVAELFGVADPLRVVFGSSAPEYIPEIELETLRDVFTKRADQERIFAKAIRQVYKGRLPV